MREADIGSMSAQDYIDASLGLFGILSAHTTGATGRPVAAGSIALVSGTLDAPSC